MHIFTAKVLLVSSANGTSFSLSVETLWLEFSHLKAMEGHCSTAEYSQCGFANSYTTNGSEKKLKGNKDHVTKKAVKEGIQW